MSCWPVSPWGTVVAMPWLAGRCWWHQCSRDLSPPLGLWVSVFFPQGVTPTSEFVCVLMFPDGDAKRHKDLSWFRQEKALHPAGWGESLYYSAPKCLYRGEYKRVWTGMEMEYGSSTTCVLYRVLPSVPCIRSRASPFIFPRRGLGYMYRRQSRGR